MAPSSKKAGDEEQGTVVSNYKPNARQLQCARQVSNWSKIGPDNRFNKKKFSIADTDKLIPIASPKLEAMLQNIEALDANDRVVFGKTFKHFIFSDIKLLGYGAKIISAGLIARGWKNILKPEVRKTKKGNSKPYIVVSVPKGTAGRNFAVLSSTPMWDSPFSHTLKKEVLGVYNKRPDNIYGEDCRLIVLDSGFKEGIDLFDVRYVHLFEPLMTAADMTQALGRATRLCGQKGLDFVPQQGWPLHVFKYSQSIPEELKPAYKADNLFEIMLQLKGLDTRLHRITKCIQDVSILAAVDQPLTEEIHKSGYLPKMDIIKSSARTGAASSGPRLESVLTKNVMGMGESMTRANFMNNKAKSMLLLEDKAKTQLMLEDGVAESGGDSAESLSELDSESTCAPRDPSPKDPTPRDPIKCDKASIVPFAPSRLSQRTVLPSVIVESNAIVLYEAPVESVAKTGKIPTNWYDLRGYIIDNFKEMSWGKQEVINKCMSGGAKKKAEGVAPPSLEMAGEKKANKKTAKAQGKGKKQAAAQGKGTKKAAAQDKGTKKAPAQSKGTKTKKAKAVESEAPRKSLKAAAPGKKGLPALKLINYTPTQDFISSYFRPESPIKGMLLWHSVGTGKTCTAIALASRQFEPAGYTIMWVTRHTLKADIWKNIFEQVCHKTVADEVRAGKLRPQDVEKRQKKLFAQWIPALSYRQFSNLVTKKNPLYKVLENRNGKQDPLRKTLIVIDEAHKLYSSDFKGAEKPDVGAFMAALQNSYKKSGKDSARVLLMTATPYNESPMELMSLLNLCREAKNALPETLPKFVAKYMDETGNFSKAGLHTYMDDIAGQISYLNREADPSQFAQPIFADIVVPISTMSSIPEGANPAFKKLQDQAIALQQEYEILDKETIPYLEQQLETIQPAYESHLRQCMDQFSKPKDIKACQKRVDSEYKAGIKLEKKNLKVAVTRREKITKELGKFEKKHKSLTKKMRTQGPTSFTQQAQLENKCKIGIDAKPLTRKSKKANNKGNNKGAKAEAVSAREQPAPKPKVNSLKPKTQSRKANQMVTPNSKSLERRDAAAAYEAEVAAKRSAERRGVPFIAEARAVESPTTGVRAQLKPLKATPLVAAEPLKTGPPSKSNGL
jgi:superfamily II DNA or RNA helicase